jgi:hypothetical protein
MSLRPAKLSEKLCACCPEPAPASLTRPRIPRRQAHDGLIRGYYEANKRDSIAPAVGRCLLHQLAEYRELRFSKLGEDGGTVAPTGMLMAATTQVRMHSLSASEYCVRRYIVDTS